MRIALAQINTTVGDLDGNGARIAEFHGRAAALGADLVLFPELALPGYPPQDLLLRSSFLEASERALEALAGRLRGPSALVGTVSRNARRPGRPLFNAAALLREGRVEAFFPKRLLPTYDVFDEDRYFEPGTEPGWFEAAGARVGVTVCEDIWNDADFWPDRRYSCDPVQDLKAARCSVIANLSASPWHIGKHRLRRAMLRTVARSEGVAVAQCNLAGGNDQLVFDGHSVAFGADGRLLHAAAGFDEGLAVVDIGGGPEAAEGNAVPDEADVVAALALGTRDYVRKCGFSDVIVGLSGGIDSALVAAIAARALGPEHVLGVSMPARVSSRGSLDDAAALAANLGIRYRVIGIEEAFQTVRGGLEPAFAGRAWDLTEENLQSRLRGLTLMALSNKFGALVLTTGNKSELAVGYCTLYGDMCGGLAVISDVPKTMVYRLARWINADAGREIIPRNSIEKAPSAELRENQTDQDTLPPYEALDAILEAYVERNESAASILAAGFAPETVRWVLRQVDRSEYKRQQAAPGLKVTTRAFGRGRRMPVAQRFAE